MASARQNITALIYDRKGRLLSMGKNSYIKTHPYQAKLAAQAGLNDKIYLHAEIDALIRCKNWNKAHKIIITRIGKNGQPALAKPCPVCELALKNAGIQEVVHT